MDSTKTFNSEILAYDEAILQRIITFLEEIGIKVLAKELADPTVLPGVSIKASTIVLDKKRLKHPGDLLHEAGHIAITTKNHRPLIETKKMDPNWPNDGDEIAAILWSYAAICHLGITPQVVFHDDGYKNESEWLIEQFENGNYIGLPLLEWMALCHSVPNTTENTPIFPKILKWFK